MHQRSRMIVETRCGPVRGTGKNSVEFLGIPYAEAPVGDLRFMAPVPRARWEGIFDATRYGATSQRRALDETTLIPEPSIPGEDTLVLNVFTPAPNRRFAKLPVMVWIHGGGYVAGSPASPWYHGRSFNARGVVTVTVGYRVGFEGFGYVEGSDAPVNRGLLDQILALKWVRENITEFGGDPGRVTLAGQSAGGGSALCLMTSPRAQGLFQQVIAQSAATLETSLASAKEASDELARTAGITPDLRSWQSLSEERMGELTGDQPDPIAGFSRDPIEIAQRFISLEGSGHGSLRLARFSPVVGDDVVPVPVADALVSGAGAEIPLLMGCTRNEFTMLMKPFSEYWRSYDPRAVLNEAGFPKLAAWAFVREHPELRGDTALVLGQLITAGIFQLPLIQRVQARITARVTATSEVDAGVTVRGKKAPTWVYEFAWLKPGSGLADHCADVPFVFNCIDDENVARIFGTNELPRTLAATMHSDWVRFVTTGQPGWNPWVEGNRGRIYGVDAAGSVRTRKPLSLEVALAKAIRNR